MDSHFRLRPGNCSSTREIDGGSYFYGNKDINPRMMSNES